MKRLSRRDFLKLAAMAPAALAFSQTIVPSPLGAEFAEYHCAGIRCDVGGQFIVIWISAQNQSEL